MKNFLGQQVERINRHRVIVATSAAMVGTAFSTGLVGATGTADYTLDTSNLQADITSNLGAVFAVTLAMVAIPVVKKVIKQARG